MRGALPPNYREVMEAVRKLQKERKAMADPYLANLKVIVIKVPILCACGLLTCFFVGGGTACSALEEHQRPREGARGLRKGM